MAIVSSIIFLFMLVGIIATPLATPIRMAIIGLLWLFACLTPIFGVVLFVVLIVYLLTVALLAFPRLRQRYLTTPLMQLIRASFSPMSQTERDAIEAGDVGWEGALFSGDPNWQQLLNIKPAVLSEVEQAFLDNQVAILCEKLDVWESQFPQATDLPPEIWDDIKQERFWAMGIPTEYGGLGFSATAHSEVITRIALHSSVAAITVMVPNALGPAELLLRYGTDPQKDHYLPRLAQGAEIPCFALTSLDAGSDAASMTDFGEVCYDTFQNKKTLGIRLTWHKRYITLAPIATVLGLAFHLYDPDQLLGQQTDIGITLCLLPTNHPGVKIGDRHQPMHIPFMNGPTSGEGVFVPMDWVIGGQAQVGNGWRMLMECLSAGRGVSLPATAAAMSKRLYQTTGAYSVARKQFHLSLHHFEGVASLLADMAGKTFIQEALRSFLTSSIDAGLRPAIGSAIAKYHSTELARDCLQHAMDIHGGKAIQAGPSNYVLPAYLASPIGITVEGANILTRNLMIFGQGVMRAHPYLLKEMQLLEDSDADTLQAFDTLLLEHLHDGIRHMANAFCLGLTASKLVAPKVPAPLQRYVRQLTRMSHVFAVMTDVCLLFYGGTLKRKETISARLGDMLSYLFMASAVMKQYADQAYEDALSTHVDWSMQFCLFECQEAAFAIINNLPSRILRIGLRLLLFPLGRAYRPVSDTRAQDLVRAMTSESKARRWLTKGADFSQETTIGELEQLFVLTQELAEVMKQLKTNQDLQGYRRFTDKVNAAAEQAIIDKQTQEKLIHYDVLYRRVLAVDVFDKNLKLVISGACARDKSNGDSQGELR